MAIERKSKQRDAIMDNLCSRYDHPTAEEVYFSVREVCPKISLATVYRNLKQLAADNKVLVLHSESSEHYDANTNQHYHLYCKECKRIIDLDMPIIPAIEEAAGKVSGVSIDSYSLMFDGLCPSCKEKGQQ